MEGRDAASGCCPAAGGGLVFRGCAGRGGRGGGTGLGRGTAPDFPARVAGFSVRTSSGKGGGWGGWTAVVWAFTVDLPDWVPAVRTRVWAASRAAAAGRSPGVGAGGSCGSAGAA